MDVESSKNYVNMNQGKNLYCLKMLLRYNIILKRKLGLYQGCNREGVTWGVGTFRYGIFEKLGLFEMAEMGRNKGFLTLFKVFEAISLIH